MTAAEARRLLGSARVARLATVRPDGGPHLVPITFALHGDRIYTAVDDKPKTTRQLARLRNITVNPRAAVLADHYADDWARLWWARAEGRAFLIDDPDEMAEPLRLLAARYRQYRELAPAGPVIVVAVTRWTGWAASVRP